jgi:hypothetical protein
MSTFFFHFEALKYFEGDLILMISQSSVYFHLSFLTLFTSNCHVQNFKIITNLTLAVAMNNHFKI